MEAIEAVGREFRFGDLAFRTLVASAFAREVSLFEVHLGPGCLSGPLRVHELEDAVSYVLDGCLTFQVGDDVVEVGPGAAIELPRGVRHTFWNAGPDPASALDVVTPGGLEEYYELLGRLAEAPDVMEQLSSLEETFGIHMDWDSVAPLMERYGLRMAAG